MKKIFFAFVTYLVYVFTSLTFVHAYAMEDCLTPNNHTHTSESHMADNNSNCDHSFSQSHSNNGLVSCSDSISDLYSSVNNITENLSNKAILTNHFLFWDDLYLLYKEKNVKIKDIPILTVDIKYHSFSDMYWIIVNLN